MAAQQLSNLKLPPAQHHRLRRPCRLWDTCSRSYGEGLLINRLILHFDLNTIADVHLDHPIHNDAVQLSQLLALSFITRAGGDR
ncbi:hypothetical protein D1872_287990 [compost metagenome]